MFVSHLYIFFGVMSGFFSPLLDWVVFLALSCMSCLYVLDINALPVVSFAIIFSYSEGCLFTLLIVSFVVQKLLILNILNIFIFVVLLLSHITHSVMSDSL